MVAIRNKLRSESGASILLALLFFLLCAMVGASVLMAAASNAGKSRSGREEQQKYLTLSSAMQLVCDELTAAEYTAQFMAEERIDRGHYEVVQNPDGTNGSKWVHEYWEYPYTQTGGAYTGELPQNVLPLETALDRLFAKDLPQTLNSGVDKHIYKGSFTPVDAAQTFDLTLSVLDSTDKPGLAQPVKVEVTLNENYRLSLKAWLEKDSAYTMYGTLLTEGTPTLTAGATSSTTIGWTLSQITREEPT